MAEDLGLLRRKGLPIEGSAGCPSKGSSREPRPLQLPVLRRCLRCPFRPPLSLPPSSPSPHPPILFRSYLQVNGEPVGEDWKAVSTVTSYFWAEDFKIEALKTCYLIDFVGPDHFALQLSQLIDQVVVIDHHKSALLKVDPREGCPRNLHLHLDTNKSSAVAAYEYFNQLLNRDNSAPEQQDQTSLVNGEDAARVLMLIKYIEDANLRKWELPDIRAFNIGIRPVFSTLNCVTNPYLFEQLLKLNPADLIAKGSSFIKSRQDAAKKLLEKPFKIRLGKGFYGECLGIRADGNSDLADEIGKELSIRSAAAGLRPIGAVVYMQRGNLKMCLRSTDRTADTSEIAKAYGGGGNSFSSSFTIRMDEYNKWLS